MSPKLYPFITTMDFLDMMIKTSQTILFRVTMRAAKRQCGSNFCLFRWFILIFFLNITFQIFQMNYLIFFYCLPQTFSPPAD